MYHLLSLLARPHCLLLLLLGVVILRCYWKQGLSRRLRIAASVLVLFLIVLALPAVGYLALGTLEWSYPPRADAPDETEALVVLAGYVRPKDAVRPRAELGVDTLYRCQHALELHRRAPHLPILVSGGLPVGEPDGPPFAETMRAFLVAGGVPAANVWREDSSRTTHENAVECVRILHERGVQRILLVTDAAHMMRAAGCFRKQGIAVVPSACNHSATEFQGRLRDFLPCAEGAVLVERAAHEWLGTFYYWLRGRL